MNTSGVSGGTSRSRSNDWCVALGPVASDGRVRNNMQRNTLKNDAHFSVLFDVKVFGSDSGEMEDAFAATLWFGSHRCGRRFVSATRTSATPLLSCSRPKHGGL